MSFEFHKFWTLNTTNRRKYQKREDKCMMDKQVCAQLYSLKIKENNSSLTKQGFYVEGNLLHYHMFSLKYTVTFKTVYNS